MTEKTYRIGEVSKLLELNSSVLRFWESEFTQIQPLRTDKGQRLYSEEHISLLRRIKALLHEQGMTIEGARRVLQSAANPELSPTDTAGTSGPDVPCPCCAQKENVMQDIRRELLALRELLHRSLN